MTTLNITNRWHTLFPSRPKGIGAKGRLFGHHTLNTTSVASVSSSVRYTNDQERDDIPLVEDYLSQLDSDATTLLPDTFSGDLIPLQVALNGQSMWSASAILENIDWSARQPGEIVLGVRLALALQAPLVARAIAAQGHHLYPDDAELAKVHRVLAPPTTTTIRAKTRPDTRANLNWLADNRKTYPGQWVALDDGHLLATADSINALVAQVGDVRHTNILITQVW